MEDLKIYWAGIEFNYGQSSPNYGKLQGGFVYGFVQAFDVREALTKFDKKLEEENLMPIQIEFISLYDIEMEWETEDQTQNYCRLYEDAKNTSEVVFDDIYVYENEV